MYVRFMQIRAKKGQEHMTEKPKLSVIPSSDQKALSNDLLDELRSVINGPKYDHLTVGQLIGVLEMAKLHYWKNILEE